ncbi:hypothetical protein COL922a_014328, partial [Colletotrichum nupharicola]
MECLLLKLPPELIRLIIEQLDTGPNRRDLLTLARVCHALNNYTMPVVYRDVTLRLGQARFLEGLLSRRPG